jgi:glucose-1-phosphate thymidylyltransferase
LATADLVATIEKRPGFRIACPEEIAFNQGFIDRDQLRKLGISLGKSEYAKYVQTLAQIA